MKKKLHAVQFDGMTFGMDIDTGTEAYKNFKKALKYENCTGVFGDEIPVRVILNTKLGAIMGGAHWLVTEGHYFDYVKIDGFKDEIYIKYTEAPIDFRHRTG